MIDRLLITGGTHGNELTGVTIVQQWQKISHYLNADKYTMDISCMMTNIAAVENRTRFVEQDLNRQFSIEKLEQTANLERPCLEERLALDLNKKLGTKTNPSYDLVVDFHNTTANLGPCLIILTTNEFEVGLGRYVKTAMPDSVILLENEKSYDEFPYLCTLGKHGVMIELGCQSHGVNDPSVFYSGLKLLKTVLDYCDLYNANNLPNLEPVECFHLQGEVEYPSSDNNAVMIHPDVFGNDFKALKKGEPCFITVDGQVIVWKEEDTYPHFIGEVAYQHLGLAFSKADKIAL